MSRAIAAVSAAVESVFPDGSAPKAVGSIKGLAMVDPLDDVACNGYDWHEAIEAARWPCLSISAWTLALASAWSVLASSREEGTEREGWMWRHRRPWHELTSSTKARRERMVR